MSIPQRIRDLANKVRNEIYGKDVRESIAKSMEVTGETAEEAKQRSIEQTERVNTLIRENPQPSEVVDARLGEPTLRHKIQKVDKDLVRIVETVDEELASMMNALSKSHLIDKLYGSLSLFSKPSGFSMSYPFKVYTSLTGKVEHSYDVAVNKNKVTKRYYVDIKNGANTNPGTEEQPFKSVHRALRYNDADEIVVKEGIYGWNDGYGGFAQTKSYNLIGEGDVYLGAHRDGLTWTKHSTYSNVYQTSTTAVFEVIDMKNFENPVLMEKKDDIQGVNNTPGSYFISGNDIHVRTIDDRQPDEFILCNLANSAASTLNLDVVYFENIKFTNNVKIETTTNPNAKFYAKNVDMFYGSNDNSLSVFGVDFIVQKCRAKFATRDGFNYHIRNGILSNGIEIDCEGAYNGRDGANQNNGSTMHDGGSILRINGEYHHNHGPNVIDVNPGTKSLNIGVHAHHSTATTDISNTDFKCGNDGGTEMWLVNCISHDSKYSVVTHGAGSVTHEDNSLILSEKIAI